MTTIMVPLDGSPFAEQVLPAAMQLATIMRNDLHLLRVVERRTHEPPEAGGAGENNACRAAGAYLESLAQLVRATGIATTAEVCSGAPGAQISARASETSAALIAMMTHGRGGWRRWALGSVADQVIHTTRTPIFVSRSAGPVFADKRPTRRILVPLDGSVRARAALPLALSLARHAAAELFVFHVVAPAAGSYEGPFVLPMEITRARRKQALHAMEHTIAELRASGVASTPLVTCGDVADQICTVAAQQHVDLIVMATHGYTGARRWALGSVTDTVLHTSPTPPLLLVRPA